MATVESTHRGLKGPLFYCLKPGVRPTAQPGVSLPALLPYQPKIEPKPFTMSRSTRSGPNAFRLSSSEEPFRKSLKFNTYGTRGWGALKKAALRQTAWPKAALSTRNADAKTGPEGPPTQRAHLRLGQRPYQLRTSNATQTAQIAVHHDSCP